jgi:arsenate reductase
LNSPPVLVIGQAGVDISMQESQHVDELRDRDFDLVVTVCDHAVEVCPTFPGARRMLHHSFDDPARAAGNEEQILNVFRRVRDEIREFVVTLPDLLKKDSS